MEQWKMSVLTGAALIVLGVAFVMIRKHLSIWLAIVIILGVIDMILGLVRKNR